jgi:MoxR-like ATPase
MAPQPATTLAPVTTDELRHLATQVRDVELKPVMPVYQQLIREIRAQGAELSDRRVVRGLKLVAAACLMREADIASAVDLWPLRHFWTDPEHRQVVQRAVAERIADDPSTPSRPARSAAEILTEARYETVQVNSGRFAVTDGLVTATLQALGRLRRELIVGYPGSTRELGQLDTLITDVEARYP